MDVYRELADRLDALPNGFPPAENGAEIRLLKKLFAPEEARLAAVLRMSLELPDKIAARVDADPQEIRLMLKSMARRGLIKAGRIEGGLGYGLMPFVVGIYEYQIGRMDAELAQLFEDYYQQSFPQVLGVNPQVHRVIPVNETIQVDLEVAPYESVSAVLDSSQAWGVLDCICRVQKALIGDPCEHPVDVCMAMSPVPGAFDHSSTIKALTREEAEATLVRAADAGLVHSVSNSQEGVWYVCNCCTCSCGILRGMAEMGIANVVARSSFVNTVDAAICSGCEDCLSYCQFNALELVDMVMTVSELRCVGCGVCVPKCSTGALSLARREAESVPPLTEMDWMAARAKSRSRNLDEVL